MHYKRLSKLINILSIFSGIAIMLFGVVYGSDFYLLGGTNSVSAEADYEEDNRSGQTKQSVMVEEYTVEDEPDSDSGIDDVDITINRNKAVDISNNGKALIDAPIIGQMPQLYNGCEVTSLAMLLQYAGINVDKMTLAKQVKKDITSIAFGENRSIVQWGDPEEGFVGDITGRKIGYGVYTKPIVSLMEQYLSGRVRDLTGDTRETLEKYINIERPVIVWVTVDFGSPKFITWMKNGMKIKASFDEHAVLLVGYDEDNYYINNPYNDVKNQKIDKDAFTDVWEAMGSMAVTYR